MRNEYEMCRLHNVKLHYVIRSGYGQSRSDVPSANIKLTWESLSHELPLIPHGYLNIHVSERQTYRVGSDGFSRGDRES